MYAETGLMFPCFQELSQEVHQLEDFCKSQRQLISSSGNMLLPSSIAEYDLGGDGDLFKAPEPIIEEPLMSIDPMTAAISMISSGEDIILPQGLKVSDIVSLQTEPLFSDVYYECGKDLMEKAVNNGGALDEVVLEDKILPLTIDEKEALKDEMPMEMSFTGMPTQKSVSLECLNSTDWAQGAAMKPSFLDFPVLEFGTSYGMRRAYSEGDIKTLGNGEVRNLIHHPHEGPMIAGNCSVEERREKLSRYRSKKTKRNFGRKIKYACRKALADSQPRIRGRFAKTEEMEASKRP
ncbi:hypothetical protein MLD38_025710 [Melastoma candidum]|uniref:Uncharacterized protein n=1 Tax=Melastoma candidum TaxID=119954 RepID=A0ACB9NVY4_9MYRT|nr:hypothetical protein MLD38_025710 [Melastoma candidum]